MDDNTQHLLETTFEVSLRLPFPATAVGTLNLNYAPAAAVAGTATN